MHLEEMIHALSALGHELEVVGPRHVETSASAPMPAVATSRNGFPAPPTRRWSWATRSRITGGRGRRPRLPAGRDLRTIQPVFPVRDLGKRRFRVPLLLEVNAPLYEERRRYGGIALPRLAQWSERHAWRGADLVLPVTEVLAGHVESAGVPRERIHVIPNGINEMSFAGLPDREAAKRSLGLAGRFVLGFVGFMREWHGLDRVLRFMKQQTRGDLHALFVGDGPDRARLERIAAELGLSSRLTITGVVERNAVPAAIAAFDVALQPAVVEYARRSAPREPSSWDADRGAGLGEHPRSAERR